MLHSRNLLWDRGASRVTACPKQLGLKGCFGVDKLRSKNAVSSVIIGKPSPSDPFEEAQIWRKQARPLRSDQFPNGLPNLTPSELGRVSLANQMYHFTAKVVKWAVEVGCIFVVENPQV